MSISSSTPYGMGKTIFTEPKFRKNIRPQLSHDELDEKIDQEIHQDTDWNYYEEHREKIEKEFPKIRARKYIGRSAPTNTNAIENVVVGKKTFLDRPETKASTTTEKATGLLQKIFPNKKKLEEEKLEPKIQRAFQKASPRRQKVKNSSKNISPNPDDDIRLRIRRQTISIAVLPPVAKAPERTRRFSTESGTSIGTLASNTSETSIRSII